MTEQAQEIHEPAENPKDVEFYAATLNAWYSTQFEHDKSLVALSTAAIGLLVTLASTVGVASLGLAWLYGLTLLSFLVCIGVLLWVFRRNAVHLQAIVRGNYEDDPVLKILDIVALCSFTLGLIFAVIIGISTAVLSSKKQEADMTKQCNQETKLIESVVGAGQLRPGEIALK